jgi:multidrug efflux pump subunit AcrA (membrane-fusion protein)
MAALTPGLPRGALRVGVSAASALPGDESVVIDPVSMGPAEEGPRAVVGGVTIRGVGSGSAEVVVRGWRFVLDVEPEERAGLRERAVRGRQVRQHGGVAEVRAIMPGRVVSVSVAVGDQVAAGQELLVVEAMKMQNELRAPREGRVERLAVAAGQTIELGDLLAVLGSLGSGETREPG